MFLKSPAKMFWAPSMFSVRATSRIGLTKEFTTIDVPCTPTAQSRWTNSMITIMPPRLPAMSLTKAKGLDNNSWMSVPNAARTPLMMIIMKAMKIAGSSEAKARSTPAGTPAGILMVILYSTQAR